MKITNYKLHVKLPRLASRATPSKFEGDLLPSHLLPRTSYLIPLFAFCFLLFCGCEKWEKYKECKEWEQTTVAPQALLNITWKLEGFVDIEGCKIKKLENFEHFNSYYLIFKEDESLYGIGACNGLNGTYEIDYSINNLNINIGISTEVYCPKTDEELYVETLNKVQLFSIQENELRLYYNNKHNYLLFKSQ